MRIAITFRDQSEQKCSGNKRSYSFLNRRETKSLSHFIESKTTVLCHPEYFAMFLGLYCAAALWLRADPANM